MNAFRGVIYVHAYLWTSACLPIRRRRSTTRAPTATPTTTSSKPRTCPLFAPLLNDKIGVGNFNGNTFNLASGNTIKLDVLNGALSDNVLNSGGCLRVDGHLAPRGTWRALTGQGIKVGFTRGPVESLAQKQSHEQKINTCINDL